MDLSTLPVEGSVRQRGEQVTRLETFVDAAFAFAMTLLVVSFDAMPRHGRRIQALAAQRDVAS
jgi:uncharacterized membrane protein